MESISDTLKGSRRNLLIVSLGISVYLIGEVNIEKFSVLGLEITSGNPNAIFSLIWMVWFYFFLRYINYYFDEGAHEDVKASLRDSLAYYLSLRQLKKRRSGAHKRQPQEGWESALVNLKNYEITSQSKQHIEILYNGNIICSKGAHTSEISKENFPKSEWGFWLRKKVWVRSFVFHPEILEVLTPFLIAVSPVAIYIITKVICK